MILFSYLSEKATGALSWTSDSLRYLGYLLPMPARWEEDEELRLLVVCFGFSVLLHIMVLGIYFGVDSGAPARKRPSSLDVILVNSKSASAPVKPSALAQQTLEGGGELEKGRSKSFLPSTNQHVEGDQVYNSLPAEVEAFTRKQQGLMTQLKKTQIESTAGNSALPSSPLSRRSALQTELSEEARALLRREAEIFKRIADEDARPKRYSIGPSTREVEYAVYYRQWAQRVERVGNNNYPNAARGRNYNLILTVSVLASGAIERIIVERSSGSSAVDDAAKKIVRLGEPFANFTSPMKARYGVLDITMGWNFSTANEFTIENE